MQRLFPIFPSGTAGAALLLLRLLVGILIVVDGTARWALVSSSWIAVPFVLPAAFLSVGLLTPYAASFGILIVAAGLIFQQSRDLFHLVCAMVTCGILALLGPGAYSFDARLFGRRRLTVSPLK